MALAKKKFGNKSVKREIELVTTLIIFFVLVVAGIFFAANVQNFNLDVRNDAAGRTYFVASSEELETALNSAVTNDSIFLRVGTYSPSMPDGFTIKNKNIRILGSGSDFSKIDATGKKNGFLLENATVVFEALTITGATNVGISVNNSNSNEVRTKNVTFKNNLESGIKSSGPVTVSGGIFEANAHGILMANGSLTISNAIIRNSTGNGIHNLSTSNGSVNIKNTILYKNQKGIFLEKGTENVIKNVTVLENNEGITETAAAKTTIVNTTVEKSTNSGITLKNVGSSVTFTNSYGNKVNFDPSSLRTSEGNLSLSSGISADNFRPGDSSPLVDKGATNERDKNDSRIDIGAFGGTPNLLSENVKPTISSTPLAFIKVGEKYNYEIQASDPDNDTLTYHIVNTNVPGWLKLENNILSGIPSTTDVGFFGIVIVVGDKNGHNVVHPVSINVVPVNRIISGSTSVTPKPTVKVTTVPTTIVVTEEPEPTEEPMPTEEPVVDETPTPEPTNAPTPTDPVTQISFVTPAADTAYEDGNVEIKWELSNKDNVESIEIKYSEDKETYKTIATVSPSDTSYTWNTTEVAAGKYIIKIEAKEKGLNPLTVAQMSPEFEVKDIPKNVNANEIVITKISPAENDVTGEFKPLIFVEFKPDVDIDKTKTYLKANGEDLDFKYTKSSIYFEPSKNFTGTKVQIEAKIVASNGAQAYKKWTFSLPTRAQMAPTKTVDVQASQKILGMPRVVGLIVLGVIITSLLLAILFFVVKLVKTLREERQGSLEAEFIDYYDSPQQQQPVSQQENVPQPVSPVTQESDLNEYLAPAVVEEAFIDPNTTSIPEQYQTNEVSLAQQEGVFTQAEVMNTVQQDLAAMTSQQQTDQSQTTQPQIVQDQGQQLSNPPADQDMQQYMTTDSQQSSTTTQQQASADPYIEELKKKYGLNGQQAPVSDQTPQQPVS